MCGPLAMAAVPAAMGVVSAVAGYSGKATAYNQNVQAANLGYANSANQVNQQRTQIDTQQSENTATAVIDKAKAAGAISASASAMGTGGTTAAEMENASANSAGRNLGIQDINSSNQRLQTSSELSDAVLRRQSQINQVQAPSKLSLALGIGGALASGAKDYHSLGGRF